MFNKMVKKVHLNLLAPGSFNHQCSAVPSMSTTCREGEGEKGTNRMFYQRHRDLGFNRRARSISWIGKHDVAE